MSSRVSYERYLWFNEKVKAGRYPNARTLAQRFEISGKTAQREIEFMRDRLGAPFLYVRERRGYTYHDMAYELPGIWIHRDELTSLLVSSRLASVIPDKQLKKALRTSLGRILSQRTLDGNVSLDRLKEKVSVKNIEYSRISEHVYHQVLHALLREMPVRIEYYSPHNGECTSRDILPLHLLQYMGTWHVIAHCSLRGEMRDFALSRIRSIAPSDIAIPDTAGPASIKEYIRSAFGIMNSGTACMVCIRFLPQIAPWIAEQVWHPEQQAKHNPDGSLCLTFTVADFREIRREIMKYGSQVEVLSPQALRDEVKEEIEKMRSLYR